MHQLSARRILIAGLVLLGLSLPVSAEFRLPDSNNPQTQVAVGTDARGGMVIVWREHIRGGAQPLNSLRFQQFNPKGKPVGIAVRVDELPGDNGRNPAIDVAADGSFIVVWEGGPAKGTYRRTVWAQRFNSNGTPRGQEIRVTPAKMLAELDVVSPVAYDGPDVSIAPDGSFVIVWRDDGTRSCNFGNILGQRYGKNGKPLGNTFRINPELRFTHRMPRIDHDADGNFVVVWQRSAMAGTNDERSTIHAQRFDSKGLLVGDAETIRGGSGRADAPSLAVAGDGSYLVAWLDQRRGVENATLLARRSDKPIIEIATDRIKSWSRPSVTSTADGGFAVAWSARDDDRWTGSKIWVRRLGGDDPQMVGPATCSNRVLPDVAPLPNAGLALVWHAGYGFDLEGAKLDPDGNELPTTGFGPTVAEEVLSLEAGLDEDDARIRRYAAERLGCFRFHASNAAARLRELAAPDGSPEIRATTTVALAQVTSEPASVLPYLLKTTRDPNPEMRAAAARALGILGLADAAPELWGRLNLWEADPIVRATIVSALVDIGGQEHIEKALRHLLKEGKPPVRSAAAAGLVRLPTPLADTADLILDAWEGETDLRYPLSLIANLGPAASSALPRIQPLLESSQIQTRLHAISCLTAMRQPVFASLLRDQSPRVRIAAANGLRKLGVEALRPAEVLLAKAGERETDDTVKGALDAAWHAWTEAQCLEDLPAIR